MFSWWHNQTPHPEGPFHMEPAAGPAENRRSLQGLNYPATTLSQMLDQTAQRWGDAPAVVYPGIIGAWSYRKLQEQINRAAAGLSHLGVRKGDRVLMILPNCPEFIACFFGASKLGAVVVNAGPLMGPDDLKKVIDLTEPKLGIGLDLQGPALAAGGVTEGLDWLWVSLKEYQPVWKRLGYRYQLWQTHWPPTDGSRRQTRMEDLLEVAPSRPPSALCEAGDLALLQPTGGTTGTLKLAELSHKNLLANATQVSTWLGLRPGQERVLGVLPMFHVYGMTSCLTTTLFSGGSIFLLTRFRTAEVLETIARLRPTVIPVVPAMVEAICGLLEQNPQPEACRVIREAMIVSGAAALEPATAERFLRLTGGHIVQGYGLTEASPVTHINPPGAPQPGSIGLPLPDTRCRVVSLNDPTVDVAPGEAGELLISGPQVCCGYYRNGPETRLLLDMDAHHVTWLHTADVVRVDEKGYYHVVDRKKHMINRSGMKVWPAKVESVLRMHPLVADVAVLGRPESAHGESVVAFIQPRTPPPDARRFHEEMQALCRQHLAPYEVPGSFEMTGQLPRTALGKLQRFRLDVQAPGGESSQARVDAA